MTQKKDFEKKYGNSEVELQHHILTIFDSYPSPFSSGSNGYLTKVRLRNGEFEFYHDWWAYEWLTESDVMHNYPDAYCKLNNEINLLLK